MNPPNTIASDTLIEAVARAIAEGQGDDFDHAHRDKPHWIETRGESGGRYRDINEPRQPDYIDAARAALTAITEAGHEIVPKQTDPLMKLEPHPGFQFWPIAYRRAIIDAVADKESEE